MAGVVRGTLGGVSVQVSEETAALLGSNFEPEGTTSDDSTGYASLKVDELKAEIDKRNGGRDEADLIPSDGKKADLIAALEADDAAAGAE